MKKLILIALSYLFFGSMALATSGDLIEHATKQIQQHTEPKFRNTFMVFSGNLEIVFNLICREKKVFRVAYKDK